MKREEHLSQYLEDFKKWLAEEGIDPESNLGRELTKQTRLLFTIERILSAKYLL